MKTKFKKLSALIIAFCLLFTVFATVNEANAASLSTPTVSVSSYMSTTAQNSNTYSAYTATVKWDKVSGATGYQYKYKSSTGSWSSVKSTTSKSFTIKGTSKGTPPYYTIMVRAYKKSSSGSYTYSSWQTVKA